MPDPNDMQFRDAGDADAAADAAGKIEEAAEDEVLDIVTGKGPEGESRSFAGKSAKSPSADKPTSKAGVKDADSQADEADPHVDRQLDHGLDETFPASDPVSINPGAD